MSGVLQGFFVIFIVVAVGYTLGRTNTLGEGAQLVLSKLVFWVATPALLFSSLAKTDFSHVFSVTLAIAATSALAIGTLYLAIALTVLRRAPSESIIGALASSYVNSANLGIPIAIFVLHDASFVVPLLLFQIVVYSPLALTALDLINLRESGAGRISPREILVTPFLNPIVGGGITGLVVSAAGWHPPFAVLEPVTMLGNMSVPGALLTFGLSLTGTSVLKKGASPRRDVMLAATLKMAAMPVLVYLLARFGFGESSHSLFAQTVIAALPTAQNVLVYANRYGRGEVLARDAALVTTLVSIPVIALIAALLA